MTEGFGFWSLLELPQVGLEDVAQNSYAAFQPFRTRYLKINSVPIGEEDYSSSSQTTSTDTSSFTTSSCVMSNGERMPRLSTGPYHQRVPPGQILPEHYDVKALGFTELFRDCYI
uniref:Uncharacterized protein n=1 Tax=Syphacia muris TaxID=451379 RepID=A0A0N5AA34_9BILA